MQVTTIAEQLFFTTVRIDTVATDGTDGSGTGFLFLHKVGEQGVPFVVTNKHVVNGMKSGALTFLQGDGQTPRLGQGFHLRIDEWSDAWFGHPSPDIDIAVCPFAPLEAHIKKQNKIDLFYRWVDTSMIPDDEKVKELDAIESVTFIGYPNGIWDNKNLLPVARRGTTASPIEVDFEGMLTLPPKAVSLAEVIQLKQGEQKWQSFQGRVTRWSSSSKRCVWSKAVRVWQRYPRY